MCEPQFIQWLMGHFRLKAVGSCIFSVKCTVELSVCTYSTLTIALPFYSFPGLPDHVHPSPGNSGPDQLLLRQQHGASGEPRAVCPRCL